LKIKQGKRFCFVGGTIENCCMKYPSFLLSNKFKRKTKQTKKKRRKSVNNIEKNLMKD
jgi:hypothetical protein